MDEQAKFGEQRGWHEEEATSMSMFDQLDGGRCVDVLMQLARFLCNQRRDRNYVRTPSYSIGHA